MLISDPVHPPKRPWGPVILATLLAGCAGALENKDAFLQSDGGMPFTCTSGIRAKPEIIDVSCATSGCHAGAQASAGLDLKSSGVAARLVNQASTACAGKVLVPASADAGYFDEKLHPLPTCGAQMPLSITLTTEQVACLEEWTRNLALGGRE